MSGMICLSLSWLVVGNEGVVALGHVLVHTHHWHRHRTELSWEKFSTGCHREVEKLRRHARLLLQAIEEKPYREQLPSLASMCSIPGKLYIEAKIQWYIPLVFRRDPKQAIGMNVFLGKLLQVLDGL